MFYTNVAQLGNKILVRGKSGARSILDKIDFAPSLFVLSKKGNSEFKSLYGDPVERISFGDIGEARDFIKRYKDVEGFPIFGNTNFVYQYISEQFPNPIDFETDKIHITTIDIETAVEDGFPNVRDPKEEILLITRQNFATKEIVTYGARKAKPSNPNVKYKLCINERHLLETFLSDFESDYPDIITGWNCAFFDVPYLVNRIARVLGEDQAKRLSPWRIVKEREVNRMGRSDINIDILGVSVLDYLDLYRKFTYVNRESYKLDFIAKVELGKEKLSYDEFSSFKDFYTNGWEKFVDYNVIDVQLVDELEDKMRLIELILTMAYGAKCNYNDIFSPVKTWDCIIWNNLYNKKVIVPQRDESKPSRSIEGAYVKEPKPGHYDWVVSFDATSLYPSIILQYNMSPETLKGYLLDTKVEGMLEKKYDLTFLKESNICMAANGFGYSREKQGFFPEIVQGLFDGRQKYKKLMIDAKKKFESTGDKKYKNDISKYNNYQMSQKILLNSLFGAWANEFFRFSDPNIAEGITITGQYIIRSVANELNRYLNKVCGTTDIDFAFYGDTDSCYITLNPLVQKFFPNMSKEKLIDALDKICAEKIEKAINVGCAEVADYTNAFDLKVTFKREAIADRGVFVAKKRYALNVYDNEGVRYKEPDMKVMGLEIVRSSTPEPVREMLRDAVKLVLTSDEKSIRNYVADAEKKFKASAPEDIAFPRSVNGMDKYGSSLSIYQKGTPIHVRGALLYNSFLRKQNLSNSYQEIREGDKIKFIYLKEPNPIKENCIAFVGSIPEEFGLKKYVDYDTMFEKSFIAPIEHILTCVGWKYKETASLEDLFA